MTIWWIGNVVLLAVIVPVVVLLLVGVLKAARRVRRTLDDIHEVGGDMVADLDAVPELATTDDLVGRTTAGLTRYGAALDRIL